MPIKVREAIRIVEADGWRYVSSKGSHRQFKHPIKSGRVQFPGNYQTSLPPTRCVVSYVKPGSSEDRMKYAIVIEKADSNYSAYVPDVPGCVTTGDTVEEIKRNIREALEFHLEGTREDGLPIPKSTSLVDYVEVDMAMAAVQ